MEVFECTHRGELEIGAKKIACAVLSSGKRIITQTALFDAFDRPRKGEKRLEGLPSIVGAKNLIPYITDELREKAEPVHYYLQNGKVTAGYDAELIPLVCELYLRANDDRALLESQERIAVQANILVRALAKVGITALIDEATGYQYERENNALQEILRAYIAEDFLKWQARFPRKYYQELYRLYDWEYNPLSMKHPKYLGKFTNEYVYEYLPEGVLEELRIKNPKNDNGNRVKRHHQFLTGDIGIPHLERHITKLITIMELSDNVDQFKENFNRIFRNIEQKKLNLE
jgi:P63C domain